MKLFYIHAEKRKKIKLPITVGRKKGNTLRIPMPMISRHQFSIINEEKLLIQNKTNKGTTLLNGIIMEEDEKQELKNGDIIEMAKTYKFTIKIKKDKVFVTGERIIAKDYSAKEIIMPIEQEAIFSALSD